MKKVFEIRINVYQMKMVLLLIIYCGLEKGRGFDIFDCCLMVV